MIVTLSLDSQILLDYSVNGHAKHLLDTLVSLPPKQTTPVINECMQKFIQENVIPCPDYSELAGPNSSDHSRKLAQYLYGQNSLTMKHESTISYFSALVESQCHNLAARLELLSAEKVIVALFAQTGETSHIFDQLHDMLSKITKEKREGKSSVLTTRDILLLTLHLYAMIGDSALIEPQHEIHLQKGFIQAMMAVFYSF